MGNAFSTPTIGRNGRLATDSTDGDAMKAVWTLPDGSTITRDFPWVSGPDHRVVVSTMEQIEFEWQKLFDLNYLLQKSGKKPANDIRG